MTWRCSHCPQPPCHPGGSRNPGRSHGARPDGPACRYGPGPSCPDASVHRTPPDPTAAADRPAAPPGRAYATPPATGQARWRTVAAYAIVCSVPVAGLCALVHRRWVRGFGPQGGTRR